MKKNENVIPSVVDINLQTENLNEDDKKFLNEVAKRKQVKESRVGNKFTKGNRFWQNVNVNNLKGSRVIKDAEALIETMKSYLDWVEDNPIMTEVVAGKDADVVEVSKRRAPSIEGFCAWVPISADAFYNAKKQADYAEIIEFFSNAVFAISFEGAASGIFNPVLIAKKLSINEKREIEMNVRQKVELYIPTSVSIDEDLPKIGQNYEDAEELEDFYTPESDL